jgi:hypothetical protein
MAKQTASQKAWYERHKNDPEWRVKRNSRGRADRARLKNVPQEPRILYDTDIPLHKLNDARYRANKLSISFDIDPEWYVSRIEAGICEASGLPFNDNNPNNLRRGAPFGPSIDRIDSNKGYTKDNCRLVCNIFNIAKNSYTDYDVYIMSKAFVRQYEKDLGIA